MKSRSVIFTAIGAVLVCFVAAVIVFASMSMKENADVVMVPLSSSGNGDSGANERSSSVPMPSPNTVAGPDKTLATAKPGTYQDYSANALANAGTNTRILFFHAPWCPQCRALDADITKMGVPDGLSIFKVDYDSNTDLRKQYGVTLQTTVIKVDASGVKQAMFVPYSDPSLANMLAGLSL